VPWVEIFVAFVASHLAGDFLLQTGWQAHNKHGGLGRDSLRRRALLAHISTYTLAFVPALAWLASDLGWATLAVAAVIAVPHLVQDDGRLLLGYIRRVKRTDPVTPLLFLAVDQSFHVLALLGAALLAAAWS
jgi:hypothetical protein